MDSTRGQTLGKMALKLQVFGPNGGHPTVEQSVRRNIFYAFQLIAIIPILGGLVAGIAALVGVIMIAVGINNDTVRRQGWHDQFAGGHLRAEGRLTRLSRARTSAGRRHRPPRSRRAAPAAGRRRPTVEPITPPTTDPAAISPATAQSTSATSDEHQRGHGVHEAAPARSWSRCAAAGGRRRRCRGSPSAAPPARRRSTRRTRRRRRPRATPTSAPWSGSPPRPRPASRPGARSPGPSSTSSTPRPIRTGTIVSNASDGSTSRSTAPAVPPSSEADAQDQQPAALAGQLAPVADRRRTATRAPGRPCWTRWRSPAGRRARAGSGT